MNNILVISAKGESSFSLQQLEDIKQKSNAIFLPCLSHMTPDEFVFVAKDYEYLAFTRRAIQDLDRNIIDQLSALKGVTVYATGYEWIDIEYLEQKGIVFTYLADYCTEVVAEHAMGMLLAMTRRIHLSHDRSRGHCDHDVSLRGSQLYGRSLGIIGYGRIGQRLAKLVENFGIDVQIYDPAHLHLSLMTLEELVSTSDFIVICANHQRNAEAIIGAEQLKHFKPGALFINPSRAQLVDHEAIIHAIKDKKLAGYAVDDIIHIFQQYEGQIEAGRILQTAHTAWYSDDAIEKGTQAWVDNICEMLKQTSVCRG